MIAAGRRALAPLPFCSEAVLDALGELEDEAELPLAEAPELEGADGAGATDEVAAAAVPEAVAEPDLPAALPLPACPPAWPSPLVPLVPLVPEPVDAPLLDWLLLPDWAPLDWLLPD